MKRIFRTTLIYVAVVVLVGGLIGVWQLITGPSMQERNKILTDEVRTHAHTK